MPSPQSSSPRPDQHRLLHRTSLIILTLVWLLVTSLTFFLGGAHSLGFAGYILIILSSSLLRGYTAGIFFFVISTLASVLSFLAFRAGWLVHITSPETETNLWLSQAAIFIATSILITLAFSKLNRTLRQARQNEQRMERRAIQIQVAAEVARDAASVHDVDNLASRAVNLICSRFGYYYAGIFLLDENHEYAVLKAATGEAGQLMLAQNHRLKVGEVGIVGFVAASGQPRIALDVGQDAVHLINPLLPQTRSEMALPLKVNQLIIGVLDVQSETPGAFDADDIAILQTLADQIAVALETANLLDATRRQVQELTILHKIATASAEAANEHILIETATRVINTTLSPDNFGVILLDDKTSLLHAHPSYREHNNNTQVPIPLGAGVCGTVALHGSPLRIADFSQNTGYLTVDPKFVQHYVFRLKLEAASWV